MDDVGRIEGLRAGLESLREGRITPAELNAAWEAAVAAGTFDRMFAAAAPASAEDPTRTGQTPPPPGHLLLHTIDPLDRDAERYTLDRLHSQGGLGRVWLARDGTLGREVAFKEILPEHGTHPDIWTRFLREARITGRLEHPGIVPVYELSRRKDSGRPFYTMRFIRGRTLREALRAYHARRREGTAGPLELVTLLNAFVGVANAVAYAHAKGVIHRDLKGDNVIVGDYGEVIVLDWGLAKSLDEKDEAVGTASGAAGAEGTIVGEVMGTPTYMSPEQAAGRTDVVGKSSDVYSLGAILFEILTGRTPISGGTADGILRRAIEEVRPLARAVEPTVPPALEAVCAKALSLDPNDRYASAEDLAEEVRRFLADEPVAAWPEPWGKRAGRWGRKHKALVAGVAALLVTAVVALSVGTVLLGRKNREIEHARANAEHNFQLAKGAVDRYLTRVGDSKELRSKGLEGLRTTLFAAAREFYETFVRERAGDAGARADLASAHVNLGNISRLTGDTKAAEESFQRAIDLYGALSRVQPDNADYRADAVSSVGNLALLLSETGRPKQAEAAFHRAIDAYEASPARGDQPAYAAAAANLYDNLGTLMSGLRRLEDCEKAYTRALALRQDLVKAHPDNETYRFLVLQSHTNLSSLYGATGRETEAGPHLEAAAEIGEALLAAHPDDPEYAKGLGATLNNLGGIYTLTGHLAEARKAHERALAIREKAAAEHPAILEYQLYLAGSYVNVGELDAREGRDADAVATLEKAERVLAGVLEKEPRHTAARFYTAYAVSWRARALDALRRFPEGMAAWQKAASFNDQGYPTIPGGLARALALRGEAAKAIAQAAAVEKAPGLPPDVYYDLAAAYALSSARDAAHREAWAAHAVELLEKAAKMGFFTTPGAAAAAAKDPDLAPLKAREGFEKIFSGV